MIRGNIVRETCGCGAKFTYEGSQPTAAAQQWRDGHRCTVAEAGLCESQSHPLSTGERMVCELRAGHTGRHQASEGVALTTWWRPTEPAEVGA